MYVFNRKCGGLVAWKVAPYQSRYEIMAPFIVAGADARDPLSDPVQPAINRVATRLGIVPTKEHLSRIHGEAPQLVMELALEAFDGLPKEVASTGMLIKSMLGSHILSYLGFHRRPLVVQTLGYYSEVSDKRIPYHSSFVMSERSSEKRCADGSIPCQIFDFILDRVVESFLTDSDSVRFLTGVRPGASPALIMQSEQGFSLAIGLDRLKSEIEAYLASAKEQLGVLRDCPELVLAGERTWLNSRHDDEQ